MKPAFVTPLCPPLCLVSLSRIPHMFSFAYNSLRRCEPRMTRLRWSGDAANWSALTKSILSEHDYSEIPNSLSLSCSLSLPLCLSLFLTPLSDMKGGKEGGNKKPKFLIKTLHNDLFWRREAPCASLHVRQGNVTNYTGNNINKGVCLLEKKEYTIYINIYTVSDPSLGVTNCAPAQRAQRPNALQGVECAAREGGREGEEEGFTSA